MAEDMWSVIHTERAALASDLADLTPEQWATQSLCDQWNVHQALAHMTTTAKLNPLGFIGRFVGSGFSFQKFAAKGIAAEG